MQAPIVEPPLDTFAMVQEDNVQLDEFMEPRHMVVVRSWLVFLMQLKIFARDGGRRLLRRGRYTT